MARGKREGIQTLSRKEAADVERFFLVKQK
ncbi:hypothetical protein PS684_03151 [Pseudomonas fluorescens]|nr:hypothetical protein PS681_02843 [Pseudomonas fluorescens]VVN58371.1 hypothetical protein PS684_03151 [Pseudomonas fluorescens]